MKDDILLKFICAKVKGYPVEIGLEAETEFIKLSFSYGYEEVNMNEINISVPYILKEKQISALPL